MTTYNKKIVVDLTPLLPGGDNGGAKVFVIELVKELIHIQPDYLWIFLVRPSAIKELFFLKKINTKFITEQNLANYLDFEWLKKLGIKFIKKNPLMPIGLIYFCARFFHSMIEKSTLKRLFLSEFDLLFCPFTAPIYHQENIPTVSIVYDLQYKTFPEFFNAEDVINRNTTFLNACKKSSKLIAISDYSKHKAIEHGNIKPENIQTIYISLAKRLTLTNLKLSFLEKNNLKKQEYFIYPANFWKHKNHEMLITALQIAYSKGLNQNIKLVLTGSSCERQKFLKKTIEKLGLQDRVIFFNYVSDKNLATLMKNCLALVFPSLYEGFGIPLVEAMVAEVPIICSNLTSLPEIAGNSALMFNPRDPFDISEKILCLFNNLEIRKNLIINGKIRGEMFTSLNTMAKEYLNVFDSVMESHFSKDFTNGLHLEDKWVGSNIGIQVGKNPKNSHVSLNFFNPEWIGQEKTIKIIKECRYKKTKTTMVYKVDSGKKEILNIPVSHMGAKLDIQISPCFIPAETLEQNEDFRKLTLILVDYKIIRYEIDISTYLNRKKESFEKIQELSE